MADEKKNIREEIEKEVTFDSNSHKNKFYKSSYSQRYITILKKNIKKQVKLAKNHGIFGFAFFYYWFSGAKMYEEPINLFLENKELNFSFFLIWKNGNLGINFNNFYNNETITFINDIKKYLISDNYLKINGRPLLAINEPLEILNLKYFLLNLRKKANEKGIGKLFILGAINKPNYINLFDACYDFPLKNINLNKLIIKDIYHYYSTLLNKGNFKFISMKNNIYIYSDIILNFGNYKIENYSIFNEYSPEKFYIMTKKLINWTKNNKNNNKYIFIYSWNDCEEDNYLEPNKILGYSSINALSKALFSLPFSKNNYNLFNLTNYSRVSVQVHIISEDLINEIINKTNNIPIKFDLFISTISKELKNIILKFIIKFSKANKFEVIIIENRKEDIFPLLIQLKKKINLF